MENKMTDQEFEVLDELYFLSSFQDLSRSCNFSTNELIEVLESLITKGWVKCFQNKDEEVDQQEIRLKENYDQYSYLASKAGLFAHNTKN